MANGDAGGLSSENLRIVRSLRAASRRVRELRNGEDEDDDSSSEDAAANGSQLQKQSHNAPQQQHPPHRRRKRSRQRSRRRSGSTAGRNSSCDSLADGIGKLEVTIERGKSNKQGTGNDSDSNLVTVPAPSAPSSVAMVFYSLPPDQSAAGERPEFLPTNGASRVRSQLSDDPRSDPREATPGQLERSVRRALAAKEFSFSSLRVTKAAGEEQWRCVVEAEGGPEEGLRMLSELDWSLYGRQAVRVDFADRAQAVQAKAVAVLRACGRGRETAAGPGVSWDEFRMRFQDRFGEHIMTPDVVKCPKVFYYINY